MAATSTIASDKRPRRRWWRPQFRLRSLLLVMLAACGLLGWWRWNVYSYIEQEQALAEIVEKTEQVGLEPGRYAWLRPFFDPQAYQDVTFLSFRGRRNVGDYDLARLARFPRLKRLELDFTSVTDAGLVHLSSLSELQYLSLKNTKVTSVGLEELGNLSNLRKLQLSSTKVDGAGLWHLASLNLDELELNYLPMEDEHLALLGDQSPIRTLSIENTQIRGPGLAGLKSWPALETLCASSTLLEEVEVAGFARLKSLKLGGRPQTAYTIRDNPALESFELSSLAGRLSLRNLPNLQTLYLSPPVAAAPGQSISIEADNLPLLCDVTVRLPVDLSLSLRRLPALKTLGISSRIRKIEHSQLPPVEKLSVAAGLNPLTLSQWGELPAARQLTFQCIGDDLETLLSRASGLESLELLSLSARRTDRPVLSRVGQCKKLQELHLAAIHLSDEEVAAIAQLPALRKLSLTGCSSGKKGLVGIGQLTSLEELAFSNTPIGDEDYEALGKLSQLTVLKLDAPELLDGHLQHFQGARNLKLVEFSNTRLSSASVRWLSEALPKDCRLVLINNATPDSPLTNWMRRQRTETVFVNGRSADETSPAAVE